MLAGLPPDGLPHPPAIPDLLPGLITSLSREKLLRLTQFCACFYAWLVSKSKLAPGDVTTWKLLSERTAYVRRLSRLGKNVEFLRRAIRTWTAKNQDTFIRYTSLGHQLGLAAFLTWDAFVALDTLAIYKLESVKNAQRAAIRSWLAAVLCNITTQVYKLYDLRHQGQRDDGSEPSLQRNHITTERKVCRLQLFSGLCDLTICARSLGLIKVSDGVVGICGILSTIMGACICRKT